MSQHTVMSLRTDVRSALNKAAIRDWQQVECAGAPAAAGLDIKSCEYDWIAPFMRNTAIISTPADSYLLHTAHMIFLAFASRVQL